MLAILLSGSFRFTGFDEQLPQILHVERMLCIADAGKAEAIASYAKQAKDETLRKYAGRIQARAIRRCGELLKQIGDDRGGRPKENHDGAVTVSRAQAASDAGLSERQRVTALRVASIPQDDFDYAVESQDPPIIMGGCGV